MSSDSFISVNAQNNRQCWDRKMTRQEFVEVLGTAEYLDECGKYLNDTFKQAERDIPRMSIRLAGMRIRCARDLVRLVPPDQTTLALIACTQTLWGYPYESSTAASGLILHEKRPQSTCRVRLESYSEEPPFRIHRVRGSKTLHASSQQDIETGAPAPFRVTFLFDMDTCTTCITSIVKKRR